MVWCLTCLTDWLMPGHLDDRRVAIEARGAFPQLPTVSLVELGTHGEVAFVAKLMETGEQTVLSTLLKNLPDDMLLLEVRGFFSY